MIRVVLKSAQQVFVRVPASVRKFSSFVDLANTCRHTNKFLLKNMLCDFKGTLYKPTN